MAHMLCNKRIMELMIVTKHNNESFANVVGVCVRTVDLWLKKPVSLHEKNFNKLRVAAGGIVVDEFIVGGRRSPWDSILPVDCPLRVTPKQVDNDYPHIMKQIQCGRFIALIPMDEVGKDQFHPVLHQLSAIATREFFRSQNEIVDDALVSNQQLESWIRRSPKSWMFLTNRGRIDGFVHVEPIQHHVAEDLKRGKIHEGDIGKSSFERPRRGKHARLKDPHDICLETSVNENSFIHIGCLIRNMSESRRKSIVSLIAGLVQRIFALNKLGAYRIVAVDYEDAYGNFNARSLLQDFGFKICGADSLGNRVYELNLRQRLNPNAQGIFAAVLHCQTGLLGHDRKKTVSRKTK